MSSGCDSASLIVAGPVDAGRSVLLERVYNMTQQQFRQYWIARVFRGEVAEDPTREEDHA